MKKNIVILGAGESGAGAALLALQKGYDVFVSDSTVIKDQYKNELTEAGISFEEGQHTEEKILQADEVIKSPGIPEKAEIMKKIRKQQIPVISEIEFAFRYIGNSRVVAITDPTDEQLSTLVADDIAEPGQGPRHGNAS